MVVCEFCNKELSSKSCLKTHQTKTKYCLEKQNVQVPCIECIYCIKSFINNSSLEKHKLICDKKSIYEIQQKDNMINQLMIEVTELKNEIATLKCEHSEEKAKIYNDLFIKEKEFVHDQAKRLHLYRASGQEEG